jgi:inhibitor of KinA sporulation pathway (predicted exonuclease)
MNTDFLVIDLEGTCCDDKSIPDEEREMIEIGAVAVSSSGDIVEEFDALVRPVRHPLLTGFCTGLTGITQKDVDEARPFPEVWGRFVSWLGDKNAFCSWGGYDLEQMRRDCGFHGQPLTFEYHCDLVKMYGRKCGHRKAMRWIGLPPKGNHHRGVDDARNISLILVAMLKEGKTVRSRRISV